MKIIILHQDENILIINKPAGLVVHADGRTEELTLSDWLAKEFPEMAKVGEPLVLRLGQADEEIIYRPGIVHRLDRETSGAMVIAKN